MKEIDKQGHIRGISRKNLSPEKVAGIDSMANRYLELGRFSGTILLAKNDSVLFSRSYGLANYELEKPFSDRTAFKTGAISELFTEAIIRKMAENGEIRLNSKVADYLPKMNKDFTINELLSHETGLQTIRAIKDMHPETEYSTLAFANLSLIAQRNRHLKSELNYNILGLLVERVSGLGFQQAIGTYLSNLDLQNTWYKKPVSGVATGYLFHNFRGNGLELEEAPVFDEEEAFSSRGIRATARDVFTISKAFPGKELSIEGYLENDGFSYSLEKEVDSGLNIVVLSNRKHPVAGEISNTIKTILKNEPYEIPLPRKVVNVNPESLKEFAGSYSLSPGMNLEVVTMNDSLFMMMGSHKILLKAQSENQFYLEENDAAIRFIRDSANKISKAILYDGFISGNEIKKVK